MTRERWLMGLFTYLVPYTVSIHGQYSTDRDTELALPLKTECWCQRKSFDASSAIRTTHLDRARKIGLALKVQSWQDAGQQGLTPTQGKSWRF